MTLLVPENLAEKLPTHLARWAPHFRAAELCFGVDALLLAAICDRESRGGDALKPKGPAGVGDGGHGRGLMQIDDRYHRLFIAARFDDKVTEVWKDAVFNIMYGTRLLARHIRQFSGEVPPAIAAYNTGLTRAARVMTELKGVSQQALRIAALDAITTGGDYVSDVLRRQAQFADAGQV